MSLKKALESMPPDHRTATLVREILLLFRRHPDDWFTASRVVVVLDRRESDIPDLLGILAETRVLDFDSERKAFRLRRDTLTELEIDRFVRRVDSHDGVRQSNLERFRRRYGQR